jgi:integrase/recombinase XerC
MHLRQFMAFVRKVHRPFDELQKSDIEDFVRGLTCDQAHKQQTLCTVRQFYAHARPKSPNPAAEIILIVRSGRKPVMVPCKAAVESVISVLPDQKDEFTLRNRLIVELAYGSGLRRGELMRLNVEDVDLSEKTLHVIGSKSGDHRYVPLTGPSAAVLSSLLSFRHESSGPLLRSRAGHRLSVGEMWRLTKKTTGYNPHLLRHACATHLLQNGCNLRIIQQLLGHRKLDTTMLYTSIDRTDLSRIVEQTHPRMTSISDLDKKIHN